MTNNLITLTIPNDDHVALRAFGKALEEMALAHGAEPRDVVAERLRVATEDLQQAAPRMMQELRFEGDELQGKRKEVEIDTTAQQVESLGEAVPTISGAEINGDPADEEAPTPTTDKSGTPWDERIHSTNKALNADGSWRLRRKPKDKSDEEWADYIKWVTDDIHMVQQTNDEIDQEHYAAETADGVNDIPEPPVTVYTDPAHDAADTTAELTIEPPVTPSGDDFHVDADVVTEQTVAGIPPIPAPSPVVVPPAQVSDEQWDFPKLMTFLTERHGKIDVATVNTLLAGDGLSSIQELNAHPDKIGPFVARVKAYLGE